MEKDGVTTSYSDIRGEWESRKIPIVGVVKSFIGQLKVGQELTRVSIPSIFLRPYSLLEEFGSRNFAHFPILLKMSSQSNPVDRMISVLTWIASCTREEDFNHKPYNPILGETHVCKLTHEGTTTYFLSEQVSHHPPITAFAIENPTHKIRIDGNYGFSIRFATNSLTVGTDGRAEIRFGDEVYIFEKAMPDMAVKNTILPGRKYVVWVGKIRIVCPATKLSADLTWDFVNYQSVIDGRIYKDLDVKNPQTAHLAAPSSANASSAPSSPLTTPKKSHSPRHHHPHNPPLSSPPSPNPTTSTPTSSSSDSKPIIYLRGRAGAEFYLRDLVDDVPHSYRRPRDEAAEEEKRRKSAEEKRLQEEQQKQQQQQQEGYGSWMWKGLVTATSYVAPVLAYASEDKTEEQKNDVLLIDFSKEKPLLPQYPPLDTLPPNSSMVIWGPLSKEIIAGDFDKADEVKKLIEEEQRTRRTQLRESQTLHLVKHFEESKEHPNFFVLKPEYVNHLDEVFANPSS